jgi:acyl carrier protein
MTEPTIEQRVCNALYDACPGDVQEILPRMSLRVDLELDDDYLIDAIVNLEDEFDIDIDDDEWDKVLTVGDVVALVTARVG